MGLGCVLFLFLPLSHSKSSQLSAAHGEGGWRVLQGCGMLWEWEPHVFPGDHICSIPTDEQAGTTQGWAHSHPPQCPAQSGIPLRHCSLHF